MVLSRVRHFISSLFGRQDRKLRSLYSRIDWNQLEAALRYPIHNKDFFVRALVHRSFIPVSQIEELESNERLEFLGDSILNFVIAEYLYAQYPDKEEGELTILRARLVNRKALAFCAKEIDLRKFMLTHTNSAGVQEKGFDTILSDAYEAVIAALYLDGGMDQAKGFILTRLASALQNGFLKAADQNFKSELLELSQALGKGIPRYQTVKEEGPDHDRTFTIQVMVGAEAMGTGIGKNKKEAEQAAAEEAVGKLHIQESQK
ncbi:MAG: ribonuclease III [Bacteroidetes bacterium]|nr:ribonuclease III [Bacteroidota bacterium]